MYSHSHGMKSTHSEVIKKKYSVLKGGGGGKILSNLQDTRPHL